MVLTAVIRLEQLAGTSSQGRVLNSVLSQDSEGRVQQSTFSVSSNTIFKHLDHVSSPASRPVEEGWETASKNDWSDSPTKKPLLQYHLRFGFGRDRRERYEVGYGSILTPPQDGARWGNLDDNSAVLIHERLYPVSAEGSIRQIRHSSEGGVQQFDVRRSSTKSVSHIPGVSGDVDIELFPFLITAIPEPFSYRNPTDTDVFIRLANFTFPIASGTITLHLNGIQRTPLHINSFVGGLGGFDITWNNDTDFDYDSRVDTRWTFFDTDAPANRMVINYPFFTVPDLAPPRILNLIPPHEAVGVPVSGPFQFDLEDFEGGVDISTLRLFVNNVRIVDGVNGSIVVSEIDVDAKNYTVQFTPFEPWLYGDLIPVSVFVKDDSVHANELFFSYSFTTEESTAPRLINLVPDACVVEVPTGTIIQADVVDGGHGLDTESIVFTVEDVERGNDITIIPIVHRDE